MTTKRVNIPITGIVRNIPDNSVTDGAAFDMINLRPKDGAWRPVGQKVRKISPLGSVKKVFPLPGGKECYMGYDGTNIQYRIADPQGNTLNTVLNFHNLPGKEMEFNNLGNILVIRNVTDKESHYGLFSGDTNAFTFMESASPDLPVIQTSVVDSSGSYNKEIVDASTKDETEAAASVMLNKALIDGFLVGNRNIRLAWQTFDGRIIRHSHPFYASLCDIQTTSFANIAFTARRLLFKFLNDQGELDALKANWKGLIVSLNIYVDKNPGIYELFATTQKIDVLLSSQHLTEVSNYYLLHKINLADLTAGDFELNYDSQAVGSSLADLEMRDSLPIDQFSHMSIYGEDVMHYNARLFLGDVYTKLYPGWDLRTVVAPYNEDAVTGPVYQVCAEYMVETTEGTKIIRSEWVDCDKYKSGGVVPAFVVNRLCYPDQRAKKYRILVSYSGSIYGGYLGWVQMVSHSHMNLSVGGGEFFDYSLNPAVVVPSVVSDKFQDRNRIQTTELNNPLFYPAANSYRVGSGEVVGLATNAIAISEGQFGQHPVYAFTSDGIYSLSISGGEVFISSVAPLAMHVCNNRRGIIGVKGGVFFTTSGGLFVISGGSVQEIGKDPEGSYFLGVSGYDDIVSNKIVADMSAYVCKTDFASYIKGAIAGYDGEENELWFCNNLYQYSWVFSLNTGSWFKVSQVFETLVNDWPRTIGYFTDPVSGDYYQVDLNAEDFTAGVPMLCTTRPIKLNAGRSFKKILRMIIEGLMDVQPEEVLSTFVHGTTTGMKNNYYITSSYRISGVKEGLMLGRSRFSSRYFMLTITGKVSEGYYMTHIEADFLPKHEGKLNSL